MGFEARNSIVQAMSDFKHWAYAIEQSHHLTLTPLGYHQVILQPRSPNQNDGYIHGRVLANPPSGLAAISHSGGIVDIACI